MIDKISITIPETVSQKPMIEIVRSICEKIEPKPLFCELPDELRLRAVASSGTVQTYTTTSSSGASEFGTSTTTS